MIFNIRRNLFEVKFQCVCKIVKNIVAVASHGTLPRLLVIAAFNLVVQSYNCNERIITVITQQLPWKLEVAWRCKWYRFQDNSLPFGPLWPLICVLEFRFDEFGAPWTSEIRIISCWVAFCCAICKIAKKSVRLVIFVTQFIARLVTHYLWLSTGSCEI